MVFQRCCHVIVFRTIFQICHGLCASEDPVRSDCCLLNCKNDFFSLWLLTQCDISQPLPPSLPKKKTVCVVESLDVSCCEQDNAAVESPNEGMDHSCLALTCTTHGIGVETISFFVACLLVWRFSEARFGIFNRRLFFCYHRTSHCRFEVFR